MPPSLNYHREGAGEPLLLVHGIGSRWGVWNPVIGLLARHRDVVAVDLPGFGFSPMPPRGTPAGVETLAASLEQFVAELGIERPHVAGNSLGGWIALELAKRGTVRSATALSPGGFQQGADATFAKVSLAVSVRSARAALPYAAAILATPRGRKLAFGQICAHPERMSAFDALENLRQLADAPWFDDTLASLIEGSFSGGEEIAVPVTIAWGEFDRLLLPLQAKRAALAVPTATMITLRGCGHVPTYDDPEQVARVILEGSSGF